MPDGSRYARQIVLPFVGADGQRTLGSKTVLVLGCGALGSVQAELAARAGIGRLILVDRDVLELSNLQRQLLYTERDVSERLPKAVAARRRLAGINSEIRIEDRVLDVTPANASALVHEADLILDGTDNFETRYLINDACVSAGRPWIHGGVLGAEGTMMAIQPGQGPCLRCAFPDPPSGGLLPTCETFGVLNTAVVSVAAFQLTEGLKLLLDVPIERTLRAFDLWGGTWRAVPIERDPNCRCCGQRRFEFLEGARGSTATTLCGRHAVQVSPERPGPIDLAALAERLRPLGRVTANGLLLELVVEPHRLVVFPDGRVLVAGTVDPAEARSLVARYIGS